MRNEPQAAETTLWAARPNMVLLWGLGAVLFMLTCGPVYHLVTWALCREACGFAGHPIFSTLAVLLFPLAAGLVVLIPTGGLKIAYRLKSDRLILRRRLLGRDKVTVLPLPGLLFSPGRGLTIAVHSGEAGQGSKAFLICLSRRDSDALRAALPEGAWR